MIKLDVEAKDAATSLGLRARFAQSLSLFEIRSWDRKRRSSARSVWMNGNN